MADNNIPYFSHDCNARTDEKMLDLRAEHGAAGYGVYFMLLEMLALTPDYTFATKYKNIALELGVFNEECKPDSELIRSVVEDFGLFRFNEDHTRFFSESFMRRMGIKDAKRKARSEAGKRGASAKWKSAKNGKNDGKTANSDGIAMKNDGIASVSECDSANSDGNKSKGKENNIKENTLTSVKDKDAAASSSAPQKKQQSFVKPTYEEVEQYIAEYAAKKGIAPPITAQQWLDHYDSNGWMVGRVKMKDWKATVRTWFNKRHEYRNNDTHISQRRRVESIATSAQDYKTGF